VAHEVTAGEEVGEAAGKQMEDRKGLLTRACVGIGRAGVDHESKERLECFAEGVQQFAVLTGGRWEVQLREHATRSELRVLHRAEPREGAGCRLRLQRRGVVARHLRLRARLVL
jgi:hypothetical protein